MPTQLDYYIENQKNLVKEFNNKIIDVVDDKHVGTYNLKYEALKDMKSKKYPAGTYMITLCTPGESEYTLYLNSNILFD